MFLRLAATILSLSTILGLAAVPASALTPQQEKMKTCSTEAKTDKLSGTDRKTFMSACLKADAPTAKRTLTSQQEKMKTCNADATGKALKGKERRAFMSTCLKG